jgi:class 3 adenylate cyclase
VARVEGDLLVCGFGMFSRHVLDVDRCFRAAAAICDYNRLYNDVREEGIAKAVQITIGVSYGQLFSGTVGNVHRLEFATYGPPIKRAELLQSRCLRLGRQLLADRNAAGRATGALELEEITISGSSGPVKLYTLPAAVMAR